MITNTMHRYMALPLVYLKVVNCYKGAHVIVCGETYCYPYLSWVHRTTHTSKNSKYKYLHHKD